MNMPDALNKAADATDARPAFASERLLAERLAAGSLNRSIRFLPSGPQRGWRERQEEGFIWEPADPIPVAFSSAVHIEVGKLIAEHSLEPKAARSLESTGSMRATLVQLQAYRSMKLDESAIDPAGYLATPSGILDLKSGRLIGDDHPELFFLRQTAVNYDPGAAHPLWDAVASHVVANSAGEAVQRFLGAALNGIPPDRKLLVLTGDGGDGKGTILRSCVAAAGGFGAVLPAEALSGNGRGAHGHELLSPLCAARLAYASEVPSELDWSLLKALSGGDSRTSKRMHERAFTIQPKVWLALATNTPPRIPDQAAADRCILVKWSKPQDPDPDIVATIATPGPERDAYLRAALRWMIEGTTRFLTDGLGVPDFARPNIEPDGLAGWFHDAVDSGDLVAGKGWTSFQPIADHVAKWHELRGESRPTDTAIGTFLRTRLAAKRIQIDGRKIAHYQATLADGVGRG